MVQPLLSLRALQDDGYKMQPACMKGPLRMLQAMQNNPQRPSPAQRSDLRRTSPIMKRFVRLMGLLGTIST
jgi:hypothetical protein